MSILVTAPCDHVHDSIVTLSMPSRMCHVVYIILNDTGLVDWNLRFFFAQLIWQRKSTNKLMQIQKKTTVKPGYVQMNRSKIGKSKWIYNTEICGPTI